MRIPKTRAPKPGHSIGVEFDHLAIRAVKLAVDGHGGYAVEDMFDAAGDYSEEGGLLAGLRLVKDRLKPGAKATLVTCLSGKQISASQIPFRKLPPEEMESALRLELRKSVPFEVSGASFDYQPLDVQAPQAERMEVLVAMAGAGILERQLKVMEAADLIPSIVDVLPAAVANAIWAWIGANRQDSPCVAVHIGPQIATIVIDGPRSSFFNRYVYFSAEDVLGPGAGALDRDKRMHSFCEEISRSLAFYEKSASTTGFQELLLLGEYLGTPGLEELLRRGTGLPARRMDLARMLGYQHDAPAGRFDLAISLAMRGGQD